MKSITVDKDLQRRWRFFQSRTGCLGRQAIVALDLARAEQWAEKMELGCEEMVDEDPDLSWWNNDEYCYRCESKRRFFYHTRHGVVCSDCGTPLQRDIEVIGLVVTSNSRPAYQFALWGIVDADHDYKREITAELFSEAMATYKENVSPF